MSEELRPCRKCKSLPRMTHKFWPNGKKSYNNHCPGCGWESGECPSRDEADTAWNDMNRPEEAPPKTVRVRILVAVNGAGEWSACGDSFTPTKKMDERFRDAIECGPFIPHPVYRWIEADVPLPPREIAVQGVVTDD